MIKVDPGAIVFTRGFSLEHLVYGGKKNYCWAIDRKAHSYDDIQGNDLVYMHHVRDR